MLCPICHENIIKGEEILLNCGCLLCSSCITEWLKTKIIERAYIELIEIRCPNQNCSVSVPSA
jgi:hypothetical protein